VNEVPLANEGSPASEVPLASQDKVNKVLLVNGDLVESEVLLGNEDIRANEE
jgi:hypothetical protein